MNNFHFWSFFPIHLAMWLSHSKCKCSISEFLYLLIQNINTKEWGAQALGRNEDLSMRFTGRQPLIEIITKHRQDLNNGHYKSQKIRTMGILLSKIAKLYWHRHR